MNDNIANRVECKNSTLDTIDYGNCILEDDGDEDEEKSIDFQIFKWALPSIYGQFFFCYVQLMIIVGLCLDGGQSIFAKFFNTKPLQASYNFIKQKFCKNRYQIHYRKYGQVVGKFAIRSLINFLPDNIDYDLLHSKN